MVSVTIGSHASNQWILNAQEVDISRESTLRTHKVHVVAEPQNIMVNLARSAIIIVDMQNDFCSPQGYLGRSGVDCGPAQKLIPQINNLLKTIRLWKVPIIWLNWAVRGDLLNISPSMPHLHIHNTDELNRVNPNFANQKGGWGAFENEWGSKIVDGLDVQKNDIQVKKHRFSGFFNTELDSILRNMEIKTLFFAGVATDICVFATLQDAVFIGYDAVMIEDCVASNSPNYCIEATKYHVKQLYGFMSSSTSLINSIED